MGKPNLNPTEFICQKMSELLNTEITSEVSDYMLSMESEASLEEYLRDIVTDVTSPTFNPFLNQALQCWRVHNGKEMKLKKSDTKLEAFDVNYGKDGFQLTKSINYVDPKTIKNTSFKLTEQTFNAAKQFETNNVNNNNTNINNNKKANKTKFMPLFGVEGQEKISAKLPGRHECECQSQKHALLNNCMGCGRVVCMQEGSGPCFFCGDLVCSKEEQEILDRNSNKSIKLKSYLMAKEVERNDGNDSGDEGRDGEGSGGGGSIENDPLMKALKQKNRLLDYDKNSTSRTRVIDDDCDYFSSSTWMSAKERDGLKKKEEERREIEYASRLAPRKFDLDFIGGRLKESAKDTQSYSKLADDKDIYAANFIPSHLITNMMGVEGGVVGGVGGGGGVVGGGGILGDEIIDRNGVLKYGEDGGENGDLLGGGVEERVNRYLKSLKPRVSDDDDSIKPLYVTDEENKKNRKTAIPHGPRDHVIHPSHPLKIQDGGFQMVGDGGWCLSMKQPWASLLVTGVKRHEGRSWYSNHRGVLWIASTSKEPLAEEIRDLENFYDNVYPDNHPPFPTSYPPSCLLGKVVVTECLGQEDYREVYPDGESESPFVFICEETIEMKIKLPMKGKPKIFALYPSLHKSAKKILEIV